METIGAFEAKTHLSTLLERVSKGEKITITRHGTPAAMLVPIGTAQPKPTHPEPDEASDDADAILVALEGRTILVPARGSQCRVLLQRISPTWGPLRGVKSGLSPNLYPTCPNYQLFRMWRLECIYI